jgi:LuxR family transcriptional regulator, maltose regulon positive regulatory protein
MSSPVKSANIFQPGFIKTCPPDLSKILPRPQLDKIFEKNNDKMLILIIGQAAQGKSTTAATWYFQRNNHSSIWITLDQEDSNPVNLFYLLVRALHHKKKEKAIKTLLALPSHTFGPRVGLDRYREWATAIYKTFPEPVQVFLDGLDRLSTESESFHFIQALIEKIPPTFKYILTSRTYPPSSLAFQNLKMGRQALLLKNEDLAFTPEEIQRYAKECQGLILDWEQVNHIHKVTEGWIGGILMLVDSLGTPSFYSSHPNFVWELPKRFQSETFQYFNQEAFKSLSPLQQDFLLRSSILKYLEPDIIREILPEKDGESILKELTSNNQFIQAFPSPDKGVIFRYHQLYKDFLTALVRSKVSEAEWRRWHLQAGACYQAKGGMEEAVYHYLEARAFQEASSLIKEIGLTMIKKGQLTDLAHWLRKLPQSLIQTDPWLLLFEALNNRFITSEENIRTLKTAIDLFKNKQDRSGLLLGLAFLIEAEFLRGTHHPELILEAEELLTSSEDPSHVYERAFLWSQIGRNQALRGNPRQGYRACQTAYLLANQSADNLLQTYALAQAVISLSILGELRQAERLLNELNSVSWSISNAEIRFLSTLSKAIYLIFKGEAQAALGLCNTLEEEVDKQGLAFLYPVALFLKQMALVYSHEHQQAEQICNQLMDLALATHNGFLKGIISFFSGLSAYWSDRRPEARILIDQSLTHFESGASHPDLQRIGARLARGLLNNRPQTRTSAIKEIRELLSYLESIQSSLTGTECHLALGLLHYDQGQKEKARHHLQTGLQQAHQRNYRHFMIISPQDTVRACLLAQEYLADGDSTVEYANLLVTKNFGPLAWEELKKLSGHSNPRVSKKAWEIRRSLHRSESPILTIETFGRLHLSFDNKPIDEKVWDRFQSRQLLMTLLSQKNGKINKEVLIEALWPEEDIETGGKNFKTALQRLRKSLEPDLSLDFGSSYLHLLHNMVFLDPELCRVDARHFNDLYREGCQKEMSGDGKGAMDCFTRAFDLYQGDFIPDEQDAPWVVGLREDLKNKYLDLLTRVARRHEQAGAFKKAVACLKQAIETDPLLEEAYRSLMSLYDRKNLYNEALRVFESCQKALKAGLDTPPDPLTIALHRGIRERAKKS